MHYPANAPTSLTDSKESLRPARRRRKRAAAVALALLAAVAAAAVVWHIRGPDPRERLPALDFDDMPPPVAEAVADARDAVVHSPRSSEAWGRLGMVLFAHMLDAEARVCFQEAARLDPREFRWPYLMGVSLVNDDPEPALEAFNQAIAIRDVSIARLRIVDLLMYDGRLDEAEPHLHTVLEREPRNPKALMDMARLALARGELDSARGWAERAAHAAPQVAMPHELLAMIYRRLGDRVAADRHLETAGRVPNRELLWDDPFAAETLALRRDAEWIISQAEHLVQQRRLREAVALLERVHISDLHVPRHHELLGRLLVQTGQPDRAADILDRALAAHPDSVELHFQRGVAHSVQEALSAAADDYRRAIELKPDYAPAWYNLGHALDRLNDRDGALDAFRNAARHRPSFGPAHVNLGRLLLQSGHRAEAIRHLRTAMELSPNDPEPARLLKEAQNGRRADPDEEAAGG